MTIHQPPEGIFLLFAVKEILEEWSHVRTGVSVTVIKQNNIHEIDADAEHDLRWDFDPVIDNELDASTHHPHPSLQLYFKSVSLDGLRKTLRGLGVDLSEELNPLIMFIVVVTISNYIEEPHQGVHVMFKGNFRVFLHAQDCEKSTSLHFASWFEYWHRRIFGQVTRLTGDSGKIIQATYLTQSPLASASTPCKRMMRVFRRRLTFFDNDREGIISGSLAHSGDFVTTIYADSLPHKLPIVGYLDKILSFYEGMTFLGLLLKPGGL